MNNYAISTSDLAESLTRSSAALVAANNSIEQSIAMTTAANTTIQDPESVGNALKVVSMRIRGVKTELEEAGEDTEGMVENTAKLQEKIMALTNIDGKGGIDILTESGDFKSTYDILLAISKVWKEMDDTSQAALLELVAGKTRGSVVAALFQNGDVLEDAYKSASDASGSAMNELNTYLDSVQGRIDLFSNSLQTMWMNLINSETIKDIVDLGTSLIKLADDIGVVNIALTALAMRMSAKYFKVDFAHPIKSFKNLFGTIQSGVTTASNNLDILKKSYEDAQNAYHIDPSQDNLNAMKSAKENLETYSSEMQNLTDANQKFEQSGTKSFANVGKKVDGFVGKIQSAVASMLVMYAITKLIDLVGDIFDKNNESAEEAKQSFDDLTSELSNTKSKLKDLESELSNVEDQIAEINQNTPLSFTDQEDLERLRAESEELKRQIEYTDLLEKQQQLGVNQSALNAAEKYKKTGKDTGKTAAENVGSRAGSGALLGAGVGTVAVGSAAAGIGSAVLGAKAGTAIGTALAPVIGTLIGAAVGAIGGAIVGTVVGGIESAADETIGATMDNMTENYERLQSEMQTAREKYMQSGNAEDQKKYEEALKSFNNYQAEIATYMTEMDSIYSQMDWDTATEEERRAMQEFYNQRDKWAIISGGDDAKVNALDRIFGEDASDLVKAYRDKIKNDIENGEVVDFQEMIDVTGLDDDLESLGLTTQDVADYFTKLGEDGADAVEKIDFSDVVSELAKIEEAIDSVKSVMEEFRTEGIVSASTLEGMQEEFGGLGDAWENYVETMMSGTASMSEVQAATEALTKAYLDAHVNDIPDNKLTYIAQLEKFGIENAKELVESYVKNDFFDANNIKSATKEFGKLSDKIADAADAYDDIIEKDTTWSKGNVDYSNRPIVSAETMQEKYPEFDWDVATTYDMDMSLLDSEGNIAYTVRVTPILEDGTVIDENTLFDYVEGKLQDAYNNGGIQGVLDADKNGYNIVIATAVGEVDQASGVLSEFDIALRGAKEAHLELVNMSAQGLIDLAAEKGIVLELADAYKILQAAEKARALESARNDQVVEKAKIETENANKLAKRDEVLSSIDNTTIENVRRSATSLYSHLTNAFNKSGQYANYSDEDLNEAITNLKNNLTRELHVLSMDYSWEDLFPTLEVVPEITVSQEEVNAAEKEYQDKLDQMNLTVTPEIETAEAIDELARFESGMKSLSEAYQEYKKEGVVSFGTLSELGETFGNIQGVKDEYGELIKLMGTSGTSISAIETQMERLATAYLSTVDANKMILESEEARQVVISNLTNMGVRNAETIVNAKLQAMAEVQEAYGIDVSNYENAEAAKLAAAISAAYGIDVANSELVTTLANKYGVDLSNFTGTEAEKVQAAKDAAKEIAKAHRAEQIAALDAGFGADEIYKKLSERGDPYAAKQAQLMEQKWLRDTQSERDAINAQYQEAIAEIDAITVLDPNDYISSAFSAKDLDLDFNLGDDFWTGDDKDGSDSDSEIDWLDHYFAKIENKIKEKEADLENTISANVGSINDKNTIIDGIIELYESKIPLLENAINAYNNRASALFNGFSSDIQNKIRNGSIDINEYDDELAEDIQNYFDYITKASDLGIELDGIKVTIADFSLQKFDNASTAFDNEIEEKFQSDQDIIEAEIGYIEEQGKRVSPDLYEKLIGIQKEEQKVLENKRATLENILATEISLGRIQIGSEQWYEMTNAINDVDEALIESKNDIESFQNSINEIYWDNFEKLIDQLEAVNSELSNLFDLLSDDDKVVDKFGNWTDEGIASLGILAQQMETSKAKTKEYKKAISDLENNRNNYSLDEYNEKMAELKDNYLSELKNIEDLKDAIVDLNKVRVEAIKEGIDKEIEAYDELIEKKLESLDADKDAHDWQKQIQESNKSISDIQRKINALSGDNSASAIAERRKLEAELAEAKAELEEAYHDRSIEQQKEALSKEQENYQDTKDKEKEALDEWLDNEEVVLQESFDLFKSNIDIVSRVLSAFEEEHGIKLSEAITDPWKSGIDAMEAYRQKLAEMKREQENAKQNAEDAADNILTPAPETKPEQNPTPKPDNTPKPNNAPKSPPGYGSTVTVKKSATNFSRNGGNGTKMQSWVPGSNFTVYQSDSDEVLIGRNGGYTGWVKLSDIEGYYKGTTGVKDDQWAFTDELGPELTLHAGPNGRLQYLTKGSGVVTADLTERLMEWGKLDPTKVLEQSRPAIGAPHITTNNLEIDLNFGSLVHVDHCDQNTLPDLQKMVRGEFDNMMKDLNQKLKRK